MNAVNFAYLITATVAAVFACAYSVRQVVSGLRKRWLSEQANTEALKANTRAISELAAELRGIDRRLTALESK